MSIIRLPKRQLRPDPYIAPNPGGWGPCALCLNYSKLTEAHVPPQSLGNTREWVTRSYLTAMADHHNNLYFPRHFRGGLKFKTLCGRCNSSLGGREDKALEAFFVGVRRIVETPVFLGTPVVKVAAQPNLIFRGLLAHLASANDNGIPNPFDDEVRELFWGRIKLQQSSWNIFYWLYLGDDLFVTRNVYHFTWYPTVVLRPICVMKLYPLGFLITQEPWFMGLPNIRRFLCGHDEQEAELPLPVTTWEFSPVWPAITSERNAIIAAGTTFGLVGRRN